MQAMLYANGWQDAWIEIIDVVDPLYPTMEDT
eukprot:COSAG04_NODE_3793_length_2526_cov_1.479604_2_plen_32_part_00